MDRLHSYEDRVNKEDTGYEDIFLGYLERLVRDLDRKVDRGKERLRRSAQAKQQVRLVQSVVVRVSIAIQCV